jgi:hypothetical protein
VGLPNHFLPSFMGHETLSTLHEHNRDVRQEQVFWISRGYPDLPFAPGAG